MEEKNENETGGGEGIGFARVRDGQPKDVKAAQVSTTILACNREHRFKEGDPERVCHLGLARIELNTCRWCTWFSTQVGSRSQLLTGGQAAYLISALRSVRGIKGEDTDGKVEKALAEPEKQRPEGG